MRWSKEPSRRAAPRPRPRPARRRLVEPAARDGEHLGALVEPGDAEAAAEELGRDEPGPGRDVEHVAAVGAAGADEEAAPEGILAERQHRADAVVRRPERGEQLAGVRPCASDRGRILARWRSRTTSRASRRGGRARAGRGRGRRGSSRRAGPGSASTSAPSTARTASAAGSRCDEDGARRGAGARARRRLDRGALRGRRGRGLRRRPRRAARAARGGPR